ncbi:hypothetical protein PAK37_18415 [Proteus mirabilis]|uniref:hypothetical protein n=1 Tax=Proteus mirabilis TaxID=584 RepID=UPI00257593B1|nr:hypothetical protein [Proteus mirabilis]MDM3554792.1 hypothetical protein [Proteus mirabilis]
MRKKIVLAIFIGSLLISGCGQKELSPQNIELVNNLKSELSQVENDISESKSEQNLYSGGLIKSLITAKTEVLEVNKALLQQRINALESGAKVNIVIEQTQANQDLANKLEAEINQIKKEIESEKNEAKKYSGGLILSMKLATIATQEQTLATLQQKYLSAKYGLAPINYDNQLSNNNSQINTKENIKSDNEKQSMLPPESGPFGFKIGLTRENIESMITGEIRLVDDEQNLYLTNSSPKKNSEFSSFGLVISPTVGLCQIRAIGNDIKTNSYGQPLRQEFNELVNTLESLYGKPKQEDILLSGSIWRNPQDWMMGLYKQERYLSARWKEQNDNMKENELSSIAVEARADSGSNGYIFLQYTFANNPECVKEIEENKKSSF